MQKATKEYISNISLSTQLENGGVLSFDLAYLFVSSAIKFTKLSFRNNSKNFYSRASSGSTLWLVMPELVISKLKAI